MISRSLVAVAFLPLAFGAPCGNSNALVRWSSKVISTVGWFEGATPIPEQLVVPGLVDDKQSIYQVLKTTDEFSKLAEFIDKVDDIKDLLDNKSLGLTLFAPNNEAIDKIIHHHKFGPSNLGDKDKDEKKEYLRQMLAYHVLPQLVEYSRLGRNSTLATELHAHDGSFGGHRRRLKIESSTLPPWKVTINNYVVITQSDIRAANGVIHKIDTPIFLPPDILDGLFLLPTEFSLTASALFKINLQNQYEYNAYENVDKQKNDRHGKGTAATTFFAPTNEAWNQLPRELLMFLFSPFGETTLRKLLAFHTIPSELVFSEWGRTTSDKDVAGAFIGDDEDLSFEWDHHFPSLLADQKLPVHVKKTQSRLPGSKQYNVELQAHGLYARSWDNVAQNGAVHILDDVLSPRQKEGQDKPKNDKDWQEWKDWLFEWSRDVKEV